MELFGGIEAGGTKFVCAVGTGPDDVVDEIRYPTTAPDEAIGTAIDFFRGAVAKGGVAHGATLRAVGIASFGPVDPNPSSPTFGHITTTPKPGWANTDFFGALSSTFDLPIGFDNDVNAAALGEHRWGAAQGLDTFIYLTIGTGIGGGAMVEGRLLHGLIHPEMGHITLPHDRIKDPYDGLCPYHGNCFEGLASGPAIEGRWGQPAETLPAHHPAWPLEAEYLSSALVNFITTISPQKIILGGGVMEAPGLFPMIRELTLEKLNGYVQSPQILDHIEDYIVPPGLGSKSGVLGAIALAQQAYDSQG